MKACQVSRESKLTLEKKITLINEYSKVDLLYVVRKYEEAPRRFEEEVIKALATKLYNKGIIWRY